MLTSLRSDSYSLPQSNLSYSSILSYVHYSISRSRLKRVYDRSALALIGVQDPNSTGSQRRPASLPSRTGSVPRTESGFSYSSLSFVPNSGQSFSMELVIEEFLQFFPFVYSSFGFSRVCIESSKGLYSLFLSNHPFWSINIISNDFLAITQLSKFCRAINLADLIAVLGSLDFVLGSVDL